MKVAFRTTARGYDFALAAPYQGSAADAYRNYAVSGSVAEAALVALLSLTVKVPHLCGLGGDVIIVENSIGGQTKAFNGTGRTGSGQTAQYFRERGFQRVPKRGWDSAMVYGAPGALDWYVGRHGIELGRPMAAIREIIERPLPVFEGADTFLRTHAADLAAASGFERWKAAFGIVAGDRRSPLINSGLLDVIEQEGFTSLYAGSIGQRVAQAAEQQSAGLFAAADFTKFAPVPSAVASLSFHDAKITMHAANSPWMELATLLMAIEKLDDRILDYSRCAISTWWRLAAETELAVARLRRAYRLDIDPATIIGKLSAAADSVIDTVLEQGPIAETTPRQSDTIFMGAVDGRGTIIGMTCSIFTPFGALVDPDETGLLLSNRARAFSLDEHAHNELMPNVPAPHTTNGLIVEHGNKTFTLGTSGGPAQFQVLAQILMRIIRQNVGLQAALEMPRIVNLGQRKGSKQNSLCYEWEPGMPTIDDFEFTDVAALGRLSHKTGIAQMAGRFDDGSVFAVSDPRGEGASLAI